VIPFIALAGTIALFAIAALVTWAFRDWQYDRNLDRELEQLRAEQVARSTARHPSSRNLPSCPPEPQRARRKVRACDLRPGDVLWPSGSIVMDLPWPMPAGTYRVVVSDRNGNFDLVTFEAKSWENVEVMA
jgi:hypothetical protein